MRNQQLQLCGWREQEGQYSLVYVLSGLGGLAVERPDLVVDLRLQRVRNVLEMRILRLVVLHHDGILETDQVVDLGRLLVSAGAQAGGKRLSDRGGLNGLELAAARGLAEWCGEGEI